MIRVLVPCVLASSVAAGEVFSIEFGGTITEVNWGSAPGYLADTQVGDRWSARIAYNLDDFYTPDGEIIEPFPAGGGLVWESVATTIVVDGEDFDFAQFAPSPFLILESFGPTQRLRYVYGIGGDEGSFRVVLPAGTIGDQLPAAPVTPAFLDGGLSILSVDTSQGVQYSIRGDLDSFRIIPAPGALGPLAVTLLAVRRRRG